MKNKINIEIELEDSKKPKISIHMYEDVKEIVEKFGVFDSIAEKKVNKLSKKEQDEFKKLSKKEQAQYEHDKKIFDSL